MASFYYVTSLTWRFDRPIHLRWFRVFENRQKLWAVADNALTSINADVDWQDILGAFLSYEEAIGIADCLQSLGHEAIALHEVSWPMSSDELADLLLPGGNRYLPPIAGADRAAYWAYTTDTI